MLNYHHFNRDDRHDFGDMTARQAAGNVPGH